LLDKLPTAESHNRILVSGCPSFGVAVDEGDEASGCALVFAALEKPLILVLAVDDADATILLDEGDAEELTLGFCDEVVEFGLHGLVFVFLADGRILPQILEDVEVFFHQSDVVDHSRCKSDHGDDDDGGEDGDDWIVHGSLV